MTLKTDKTEITLKKWQIITAIIVSGLLILSTMYGSVKDYFKGGSEIQYQVEILKRDMVRLEGEKTAIQVEVRDMGRTVQQMDIRTREIQLNFQRMLGKEYQSLDQ